MLVNCGDSLTASGIRMLLTDLANQLEELLLENAARNLRIGGERIGIQLKSVCAGRLDVAGELDPTAGCGAADAGHHRNGDCVLDLDKVLKIFVLSSLIIVKLRQIA